MQSISQGMYLGRGGCHWLPTVCGPYIAQRGTIKEENRENDAQKEGGINLTWRDGTDEVICRNAAEKGQGKEVVQLGKDPPSECFPVPFCLHLSFDGEVYLKTRQKFLMILKKLHQCSLGYMDPAINKIA